MKMTNNTLLLIKDEKILVEKLFQVKLSFNKFKF